MAHDNLDQRLDRIEGRLEGIEHDITRLAEMSAAHLAESRAMRTDIRSLADQFFVQGGVLIRLEHRDRNADGTTLALQQQIHRLQERVRAIEEKLG
jgi:uncharacterized coiled-coil protein SlyX